MGFEIVHGTPQMLWAPVINTDTLYVGQLVRASNEGVLPINTAVGAADKALRIDTLGLDSDGGATASNNTIFGVVVGTNLKTPSYSSTVLADGITYVAPSSAGAEDYVMTEGPWAKGDLQAMVKIALIDPTITLRGKIYTDTVGTAPTVQTVTSGASTLGVTSTTSSDEAGIASLSTIYFRTGTVAGAYRVTDDSSQTAITWDTPTVSSPAVNDTFVRVNYRPQGRCRMQVDSEAMFCDAGATVTSNYFSICVTRLDLSVAGGEYIDFKFDPAHFTIDMATS